MDQTTQIIQSINSLLWGMYGLIPLLVGTGLYFTFKLRFVQIKRFVMAARHVFGGITLFGRKADKDGMSSFQSLATAISAQVGTGNLAGVATAIAMGGPGAIFWMWIAAFFGMATIFSEAVLAQLYRTRDAHGHLTGGPAYYISQGLGSKTLAAFFSVAIIIALGFIGNMVESTSIADAFQKAFSLPPLFIGVLMAGLAAFVFFGGMGRIAAFTEKVVPIMAGLYLLGGLVAHFVWDWHWGDALVLGMCLSCASTVVLLKALEVRGILQSMDGQIAVGWLVVEDVATVLILVLLPPLAGLLGSDAAPGITGKDIAIQIAITIGNVIAFIAVMMLVGRRVLPWIMAQVARTGSRELFTLCVLAIAIGIAYGAGAIFNVSYALGAFFAGMVMRESSFAHRAARNCLPLQDAFSVLFFIYFLDTNVEGSTDGLLAY